MSAEHLEDIGTLRNGVIVRIRPIRPTDKAGIVEAFGKLHPESIYSRFFHHKSSLSQQELATTTEVDLDGVVALVVTAKSGDGEKIIAGGRYVLLDPTVAQGGAEVAFLVAEDFHGQGIAGRLLQHLAQIARGRGICQFHAEVLPQNKAMLAVFAHSDLPMQQRITEGVVHVTLSLPQP